MKKLSILLMFCVVLPLTSQAQIFRLDKKWAIETPNFLMGLGGAYHTTDINNFETTYETESWFMYNIDFALKLWQFTDHFSVWGQLSFTGGPVEVSGSNNGTSFTYTWSQSFVNYGIRWAYTTTEKSICWLGYGLGDGQGKSTVKIGSNTNSNTMSSKKADSYFEIGATQFLFDDYYVYGVWRGVSQKLADYGSDPIAAGGQHMLIGVGYQF
ncbi:hypothetical protein EP331_15595 [bacterium]|nr:MAG: hypothetical protein EP331_15595 [bacterium]